MAPDSVSAPGPEAATVAAKAAAAAAEPTTTEAAEAAAGCQEAGTEAAACRLKSLEEAAYVKLQHELVVNHISNICQESQTPHIQGKCMNKAMAKIMAKIAPKEGMIGILWFIFWFVCWDCGSKKILQYNQDHFSTPKFVDVSLGLQVKVNS